MRRRTTTRQVTGLAITALLTSSLVLPAGAGEIVTRAGGDEVPAVRYAGDDRFDTAALIATDDTSTGAVTGGDSVILTRGDTYPDGLAGALLAGAQDAPMLLTGTDTLPATTRGAIDELAPTTVYLLGGRAAISRDIATELRDAGHQVERVEGVDRFATAAAIATMAAAEDADTAIVASGTNFPDALVAGPIAAVGGHPLLLTAPGHLPQVTADTLTDLGVSNVVLAGGTSAVAPAVQTAIEDLGIAVERVFGTTRYETATAFADWAVDNLDFSTRHVNLATGETFADALALAPHAAMDHAGPAPILLTATAALPDATGDWLRDHASAGNTAIHVAGGTAAVSARALREARAAFTPADYITPEAFAAGLSVDEAHEHLVAMQAIADAHGGTREASSSGYVASVDYIKAQLDAAGYETTVQEFDFDYYEELSTPELDQTAGTDAPQAFTVAEAPDDTDADFAAMSFTGTGEVTAPLTAVDLALDDGASSTSGCEAEDFTDFPTGDVALVQRGACAFGVKAANALEAGAAGVIVFNQGDDMDDPERTEVFFGTLGAPIDVDEDGAADGPVVSASYAVGAALAADDADGDDVVVHIATESLNEQRSSSNLLADTPGGDPDNVVMAGAHLDSVAEGPGINDNASGSAALLEVALHLAESDAPIHNRVRFAWWGAEESGLVGSTHYVDTVLINEDFTDLTEEGYAVALYLNFDMVASPNFARFVYDGDGSEFGVGDAGSGVIEEGFTSFFDDLGLASEPTEFSGRSDYAEFQVAGIPTGGLFTGAEGIKTEAQVELYGGEAGVAYDPCYHAACDDLDNISMEVFEQMLQAIGHELYGYALSTHEVDHAVASAARTPTAATTDQRGHHRTR